MGRIIGDRKFCPRCRIFKLLATEFGPNSTTKDGYQTWCRACRSKTNPKRKYNNRMDRFWKSYHSRAVKAGECLEWAGRYCEGHPAMTWMNKPHRMVRRLVYQFSVGEIRDDEYVSTTCDNDKCVRQNHLIKISRADLFIKMHNACSDACAGDNNPAHRHPENLPRGENAPNAKLTEDDVRKIREMYSAGGVTYRELAMMFGIARPSSIGEIVRRESWHHI